MRLNKATGDRSQLKREAAFLQSTHVALLQNLPCYPECSEGTEAEGGKNNQSVFNSGPCPGSFATLRRTRVDSGCFLKWSVSESARSLQRKSSLLHIKKGRLAWLLVSRPPVDFSAVPGVFTQHNQRRKLSLKTHSAVRQEKTPGPAKTEDPSCP